MKYLIPEPGTTISGFADEKKINADPRFVWHVTVNTHIFLFGLIIVQTLVIVTAVPNFE
jgi:hypothetical protein